MGSAGRCWEARELCWVQGRGAGWVCWGISGASPSAILLLGLQCCCRWEGKAGPGVGREGRNHA